MSAQDLTEAAAKVQGYLRGHKLTVGTVLAAYLRRSGLPTSGIAFDCAKAALGLGLTFEEAVKTAEELLADDPSEPSRAPTHVVQAETYVSEPDPENVRPIHDDRSMDLSWSDEGRAAPLDWFPKQYGPGDIDGSGTLRMLGAPALEMVDLLVRETAQNSWDARQPGTDLRFGMHLRTLTDQQRGILRTTVLAQGSDRLPVAESLRDSSLRVLEITDRGTSGLDGPTRNDLKLAEGQSSNYIDLILNVGAPPGGLGGGTYGYGKVIAYRASKAQTVIFWSRSRERGAIEDRFVVSGIGENFEVDGRRFTGRHWWGRVREGIMEPLRGAEARLLAQSLFAARYAPGETGTSIMVIDPDLGDQTPAAYMGAVRESVLVNLWPKLVAHPSRRDMGIRLFCEAQPVSLPDPRAVPVLQPFVDCLQAIRAEQEGGEPQNGLPVETLEIRSQRPIALVGHLALTRSPILSTGPDLSGLPSPARYVCLMRNDAELVVKYREFPSSDIEGFHWAGVFKPVATMDPVFASSEPPAHDEWNSGGLPRPGKVFVNKAHSQIREYVGQYLRPVDGSPGAGVPATSAAVLGDRLAGFIASGWGTRPTLEESRHGRVGSRAAKRPRAQVSRWVDLGFAEGWRRVAACIELEPGSQDALVHGLASVGIDRAQREVNHELVRILGWADHAGGSLRELSDACRVVSGGRVWLEIQARSDLVVDLQLSTEAAQ